VRSAVDAGVDLIQVRERDLHAADLSALVRDIVGLARGTATRVVVNDRLDVAIACGADGVHLRGDSVAPASARRLAPAGFLIGRSVHTLNDAIQTTGADYLIAGTVFPSASKPGGEPLLTLAGLKAIADAVSVPVLAIGGVTADRIGAIAVAGASGLAAIGLFMGVESASGAAGCRAVPLRGLVEAVRSRFDSLNMAP
jgi:thiamine-phosphate pyrophosphorylase